VPTTPTRRRSTPTGEPEDKTPVISGVVESSPASARLILIGSSTFLSDTAISLATEATQSRYLKPLELIQNAVDWSLEDRGLLTLRGRGQFNRLLEPVGREGRIFWETLNYVLASPDWPWCIGCTDAPRRARRERRFRRSLLIGSRAKC
jgi:ABC-2 type transport system permease protein